MLTSILITLIIVAHGKTRMEKPKKYVFVMGGVMSSVGKGTTCASIATLLQSHGYRVTNVKCDMYVNIDAGTIRPTEHGEVFVGEDGIEADQDLGTYERFTNTIMSADNYITTGQVYQEVIRRERNLEYEGEDVEVVPDIPHEIIRRIMKAQQKGNADITVIEFGGTIGEYQVLLFLEAARIMKITYPDDVIFVLVSYLPLPHHVGEMKTKPTQYAVRTLSAAGIQTDFIIARGEQALDDKRREILARVCNLRPESVIAAPDVTSIYDVPLMFREQGLDTNILSTLQIKPRKRPTIKQWEDLSVHIKNLSKIVKIGIIGKYFNTGNFVLADSYISVIEATRHACWAHKAEPQLTWIDAVDFEQNPEMVNSLLVYDAILIPGGYGARGVEGMIQAIRYIREHPIPYLGICYGMQLACVEFARHVLNLTHAHTTEIDPHTPDPIIYANPHQMQNIRENRYGGTMRLGAYETQVKKGSHAYAAYKSEKISERHRHRYEFNNAYAPAIEKAGLKIVGIHHDTGLAEIVELENHPFFVGTQFHPEFKSSPINPHPLFKHWIAAALNQRTYVSDMPNNITSSAMLHTSIHGHMIVT